MKQLVGGATVVCADGSTYTVLNSDYFDTASGLIDFVDDICNGNGGAFTNH